MKPNHSEYNVIVIGSGPAGQNAAIESADCGARTLIVERELEVGGACVRYGTIPSKTLRETAVTLTAFQRRSGGVYNISRGEHLQINSLMTRLNQVVHAHQETTRRILAHGGVERIHGQAAFLAPQELQIQDNVGRHVLVHGDVIIIATGSRPRNPPEIPVDHENILDSDSVLSMTYLPQSLAVFGGGVIASEYAATFACLGVRVVMIDRYPTPLGFLDADLVSSFVRQFNANGGEFRGNSDVRSVAWDGISQVITTLKDGTVIKTDKALVAQGRVANTDALGLEAAGLTMTERGLIAVDEHLQTKVPSIYAVGDAIGPPALASTSMEQGRCAARHALGKPAKIRQPLTPMGIYTIPEIASVGSTDIQAKEEHGDVLVGRVNLTDLGRGQIMAASEGLLKLVADCQGNQILGVQIVGDGATELIHLGQMAMLAGMSVEELAGSIFNFPTLAEAYRMAALDILHQRTASPDPVGNCVASLQNVSAGQPLSTE